MYLFVVIICVYYIVANGLELPDKNIPDSEMSALKDLYYSTDGDNWRFRPVITDGLHWNFTGYHNPCVEKWQGLQCIEDNNDQHILSIVLNFYYLTGFLPDTIGNFSHMEELSLRNNNINGNLPSTISKLSHLHILQLTDNFLTSSLPNDLFASWKSLEYFSVSHNLLTGTISPSIGLCANLTSVLVGNNYLTGTAPAELGNLTQLIQMYLLYNKLNGSIPSSLGQLTKLQRCFLSHNNFTSTIPLELMNLHSIIDFDIGYNQLTGTIPRELFNLTTAQSLYMNGNRLVGSIPAEIGHLYNLTKFSVEYNYLTGSLPPGLYHNTNMTILSLSYNSFTGSISNQVGVFRHANTFDFAHNLFTNSIPADFSQLSDLNELYLQNNLFTGPVFITDNNTLDVMWLLDFSNNFLSGPFPSGVYNMTRMTELNGLSNMITGSIGDELSDLVHLRYIDLSYNQISGPIPTFDKVMEELKGFLVVDNAITGTIVVSGFMNASRFVQLELSTNYLTGTVPVELCSCLALTSLSVEYNFLSGTLPSALSNLTQLGLLTLSNNMLSGHLPTMQNMLHLAVLFVQSNHFSGSLEGMFQREQKAMSYIDVGNNQFTGTLPVAIFELPNLLTFAAVSNCITGPIPLQVCNQTFLYFLDLDGLSAAPACQQRFVPHSSVFKSYALTGHVTNGIPSCLFAMPNMNLLHLSGNAIEWHFPSDLVICDSLSDLSISHNILTGTIPDVIQLRTWTNLDLSFNRLTGELQSGMTTNSTNTTLTLRVNRLSGDIPSSLQNAQGVDILEGNVFTCGANHEGLPVYDPVHETYQCGSNSFNQSIVAWGVLMFIFVVMSVVIWVRSDFVSRLAVWSNRTRDKLTLWYSVFSAEHCQYSGSPNVFALDVSLRRLRSVTAIATCLIVLVFVPIFCVLSSLYPTLTVQYAWFVSAAYLKGRIPAIVLAVFCVLFVLLLLCLQRSRRHSMIDLSESEKEHQRHQKTYIRYALLFAILTLNCVIMIVLNSGYVYITLTYGTELIIFAQVCVALFKLFWNDVAVRWMVLRAREIYASADDENQQDKTHSSNNSTTQARNAAANHLLDETVDMPFLTFIILFNSILAPCLANMAVSPSCFKNVIVAVQEVDSTVTYNKCNTIKLTDAGHECLSYTTSSVGTTYNPPFLYNYQCSSSFIANYASVYVYMYLFVAFIKPLYVHLLAVLYTNLNTQSYAFRLVDRTIYTLLRGGRTIVNHRTLFFKEQFVLRIVGKLSIFLTFGVMFPPLAVVICVALVVDTYLMQLMIGYFLTSIVDEQLRHQYTLQLERDCQGVGEEQNYHSGLVILFAALFYAFFVFDIYGDAAGWEGAMIVALCVVFIPLTARLAMDYCLVSRQCALNGNDSDKGIKKDSDLRSPLHHKAATNQLAPAKRESEIRMSTLSQNF